MSLFRIGLNLKFRVGAREVEVEIRVVVSISLPMSFKVELCLNHDSEVIFILRKEEDEVSDNGEFKEMLNRIVTPEPWCIDSINFDGGALEIIGWALAPDGRQSDISFTLNDKTFDMIEYPTPRPDIVNVFWYKPGAESAAFRCRTSITAEELFKDGFATLKCIDSATGLPLRQEYNWYYPDDRQAPALPDAERRRRVAGNENPEIFRLEGYTTLKKLDLALRQAVNRSLGEFRNILDWGCGCGRIARYFHSLPNVKLTGIDIDSDNLNWCKEHFDFGEFRPAPLHPPTDLEPSSFDLLIGISVFSHLKEGDQLEWLHELNRIAKPGAYLLMSVLGASTACRSSWNSSLWEEWQQSGIFVVPTNDLKGYIEDDNYYCNTYMTEDYIRQNWSRVFSVVEIIRAYIGNQQDLVILRKPD